jgi:2-oxoglutarate ferredoxin oxidoreductase subunit beta
MVIALSMAGPSLQMFGSKNMPTWCAGCGDFGVWMAIKKALVNLEIFPHEVLFVFDVGCSGNMSDKIGGYCYHSLHGRVLPLACGASLANRNVKIIGFGGDGANYGEGVNHLINTFRGNFDITMIIHNNGNYGLTTGQASAATKKGCTMNGSPQGVVEDEIDPVRFALGMKGSFIGRSLTSEIDHMVEIFQKAILHKGFSFVDVIQACPTYDRVGMFDDAVARKNNIADVAEYDATNYEYALRYNCLEDHGVPIGVLYQDPNSIPYMDRVEHRKQTQTELYEEVQKRDISHYLNPLR